MPAAGRSQNLFWQGVINFVGALAPIPIWKTISTPALELSQVLTALSGLYLMIRFGTLPRVKRSDTELSMRQASFYFLLNLVPVLLLIAIANLASFHHPTEPISFQTTKLSLLTVSLLTPPLLWVGLSGILAFTFEALIQFALFSETASDRLGQDEPVATLIFAAFAFALLMFRLRSLKTQTEALRAEAEAISIRKQMHRLIALKDLMSSPLQTLELNLALIERACPECRNLSNRCTVSVARLADLNTKIREQVEHMEPDLNTLSFDAHEKLRSGK